MVGEVSERWICLLTLCRWRNLIDRCLPRQDLMEIAWHEVADSWKDEISTLAVGHPYQIAY